MGLRPPYDQIYFYHCFRCPSLNGTVSMDRHLAALLVGLSFKANYRSTAKPVNVLNTVAEHSRQTTQALPPTNQSVDIPDHIVRRSRIRRLYRGGEINPLYDLSVPLSAQSTFPPNAPSVAASSSPVPAAYGSPAPTASSSSAPAASSSPSQATSSSPSQGASLSPPPPDSSSSSPASSFHSSQPPPQNPAQTAPGRESETVNVENNSTSDQNNNNATADNNANNIEEEFPQPSTSRIRNPRRTPQTPADRLERYCSDFDPNGIYQIPGSSQVNEEEFSVNHLQKYGLINDGNICSLLSVILCFHRIGLKDHLIDPHFCFTLSRVPDYPSWVFMKILSAMPSQSSFSLQLFIES